MATRKAKSRGEKKKNKASKATAKNASRRAEAREVGAPIIERDDFLEIAGIDPRIDYALTSLGIFKFEQLADRAPAELAKDLLEHTGVSISTTIIRSQNWIGRAKRLASTKSDQTTAIRAPKHVVQAEQKVHASSQEKDSAQLATAPPEEIEHSKFDASTSTLAADPSGKNERCQKANGAKDADGDSLASIAPEANELASTAISPEASAAPPSARSHTAKQAADKPGLADSKPARASGGALKAEIVASAGAPTAPAIESKTGAQSNKGVAKPADRQSAVQTKVDKQPEIQSRDDNKTRKSEPEAKPRLASPAESGRSGRSSKSDAAPVQSSPAAENVGMAPRHLASAPVVTAANADDEPKAASSSQSKPDAKLSPEPKSRPIESREQALSSKSGAAAVKIDAAQEKGGGRIPAKMADPAEKKVDDIDEPVKKSEVRITGVRLVGVKADRAGRTSDNNALAGEIICEVVGERAVALTQRRQSLTAQVHAVNLLSGDSNLLYSRSVRMSPNRANYHIALQLDVTVGIGRYRLQTFAFVNDEKPDIAYHKGPILNVEG